jgi:hypothetical protein
VGAPPPRRVVEYCRWHPVEVRVWWVGEFVTDEEVGGDGGWQRGGGLSRGCGLQTAGSRGRPGWWSGAGTELEDDAVEKGGRRRGG